MLEQLTLSVGWLRPNKLNLGQRTVWRQLIAFGLLGLASASCLAETAHWDVAYSGGAEESYSGFFKVTGTYSMLDGVYTGSAASIPPAVPSSAKVSGQLTAELTWDGDTNNDGVVEVSPPSYVVVCERVTLGCYPAPPTGTLNNGIDGTSTSPMYRYSVKSASTGSITVTCSPSAQTGSSTTNSGAGVGYLVTVPEICPNSIEWTNSLGLITNWNTDFATDGGTVYPFKGWQKGTGLASDVSYPLLTQVNLAPSISCNYSWSLSGYQYATVYSSSGTAGFTFSANGLTNSGTGLTYSATASSSKQSVGTYTYGPGTWNIATSSGSPNISLTFPISPANSYFVTWGSPISGSGTPTYKRVKWVCDSANLASTRLATANGIWSSLGPVLEPTSSIADISLTWELLDLVKPGDCLMQANLMVKALKLIGINGDAWKMRPSSDSNVFDVEHQTIDGRVAYLVFYGSSTGVNVYEGLCRASFVQGVDDPVEYWYALWPSLSGATAISIYNQLQMQLVYVYTYDNEQPDDIADVESLAGSPFAKTNL